MELRRDYVFSGDDTAKVTLCLRQVQLAVIALLSVGLTLTGCGSSDLGRVSGKITLDGQPLSNAFVEFTPTAEDGGVSYGKSDENGNYKMMFSRSLVGASLGENRVRITTADVMDDDGREVRVPEKVPSRYNRESELIRTVKPGSNTMDFELNSEK